VRQQDGRHGRGEVSCIHSVTTYDVVVPKNAAENNPDIAVVEGDLTTHRVDAIVNAANGSLMGGGGVDGAIHRAGGPSILAECRELRRTGYPGGLPTGRAVATGGGDLPARWVIHTVGPVYRSSEDPAGELASCHIESLRVADELGARTLAFPAISTGVFGYPIHEAAGVAVAAVRGAETAVEEVRFVLFGREAFDAFERALGR
jgi:O-acetyl-ADP-ribose deacetylase (regulator of RNase III)